MYITQEYDFSTAIRKQIEKKIDPDTLQPIEFAVNYAYELTPNLYQVDTTYGTFGCETIETEDGIIYMKVIPFI